MKGRKLIPESLIVFYFLRLRHRQIQRKRLLLHRRSCEIEAATAWFVRLRDNQFHRVTSLHQFRQGGHGEGGRSEENEIERFSHRTSDLRPQLNPWLPEVRGPRSGFLPTIRRP